MDSTLYFDRTSFAGKQIIHMCFRMLVLLLLNLVFAASSSASVATLYLAPHGNDNNGGQSPSSAFLNLQHALNRAYEIGGAESGKTIRIYIAPGKYEGQIIKMRTPPRNTKFEIVAAPDSTDKPIFDGVGKGGTWFILQAKTQRGSTFLFDGLEIRNYLTAISFNGFREQPETYLGNNTIQNMIFENIGQISAPKHETSSAAIRFVNSRNNVIKRNKFIVVRNNKCNGMHALYIAHHSSNNQIIENEFNHACGSPIRLRDSSNDNLAIGNIFKDIQSKAVFDEWYCNRSISKRTCTKKTPECPSWNNRFEKNEVEGSSPTAMTVPTVVHVPEVSTVCNLGKNVEKKQASRMNIR